MSELEETIVKINDPNVETLKMGNTSFSTSIKITMELGDIVYQLQQQGIEVFAYKTGQNAFFFASEDSEIMETASHIKEQFELQGLNVTFEVRSGKQ